MQPIEKCFMHMKISIDLVVGVGIFNRVVIDNLNDFIHHASKELVYSAHRVAEARIYLHLRLFNFAGSWRDRWRRRTCCMPYSRFVVVIIHSPRRAAQ